MLETCFTTYSLKKQIKMNFKISYNYKLTVTKNHQIPTRTLVFYSTLESNKHIIKIFFDSIKLNLSNNITFFFFYLFIDNSS